MPAKRGKRRHDVKVDFKNRLDLTIAGSSLSIYVRDQGRRLGVIEVGQGSIIWWGRNKKIGKRIGWNELAKLLENASGREIRLGT